ncbi:MAG TPA: TPM domain-containing protein [Pyrinomonadaceae bacterium]|nr:TPM domain-containing protein [Pyrinomonadaceae bacterium]
MPSRIILLVLVLTLFTSCTFKRLTEVKNATPTPSPSPILITPRLPSPKGYVNDFANVFDAQAKARLEAQLTKLKEKSNIEFAVATVDTTQGESIFNYSLNVAREWGIGPKDTSQGGGMLLMLAINDRRWHLQVSRSLEKDLPNEVCKELGQQSEPLYAKGDYAGGAEKYVTTLIERLEKIRNFNMEGGTKTR